MAAWFHTRRYLHTDYVVVSSKGQNSANKYYEASEINTIIAMTASKDDGCDNKNVYLATYTATYVYYAFAVRRHSRALLSCNGAYAGRHGSIRCGGHGGSTGRRNCVTLSLSLFLSFF